VVVVGSRGYFILGVSFQFISLSASMVLSNFNIFSRAL